MKGEPAFGSELPRALATLLGALNWAYDRALDGIPGFDTADDLASSYTEKHASTDEAIDALINWQIAKAATAGFVTNLGGLLTLPATIPANLASVLFIQLRMIAAIACIRGYDVRSDQVRTLAFACLSGSAVMDVLKPVGIKIGSGLTRQAVMKISGEVLKRINRAVGFRLLTKSGSTGAINLVKIIPFVGGLISGSIDAAATKAIGEAAKAVFSSAASSDLARSA